MRLIFQPGKMITLPRAKLVTLSKRITRILPKAKNKKVAVIVLPNKATRALNIRYRKKKTTPNVLSFPLTSPDDRAMIGEVYLSEPHSWQEAKKRKKDPQHYSLFLIVHGILHLLGYDHKNEKDAKKMEALEDKILSL